MGGEGLSIQYYQNNALDAVMELYSMSTDHRDVKCFLGGQKWHLRGSGCLRSVHQKQSLRWGFIEGVPLEDPGSKGSRCAFKLHHRSCPIEGKGPGLLFPCISQPFVLGDRQCWSPPKYL